MIDSINYHIPIPQLQPSEKDKRWVIDNIKPLITPALENIEAFERIEVKNYYFKDWAFQKQIYDHFLELGIVFQKLAVFLSAKNPTRTTPHIDGTNDGNARISRLNIPIEGLEEIYIEWWNKDKHSPEVTLRKFKEYRNGQLVEAQGLTTSRITEPSVFQVYNPGPCWNRTELIHRLDLSNLKEQRFVITAQLRDDKQITWKDLTERLYKLKYI